MGPVQFSSGLSLCSTLCIADPQRSGLLYIYTTQSSPAMSVSHFVPSNPIILLPFSSALDAPASGSFPRVSSCFVQVWPKYWKFQTTSVQLHEYLGLNIPSTRWTGFGLSTWSPGLKSVNTQQASILQCKPAWIQLSSPHYGKNHGLD